MTSSWGSGYVTDIEYSEGFYPDQAPAHLTLAATFNGFESLPLEDEFTYCELGCGRGKTSLVLAAIHPRATFHAVDFHPAHIAHAREQARRAGLRNIEFHELSFEDLTSRKLPMFDAVTMHGVWTWIAPHLQQAIVGFLNANLNPGGVTYVSYNALPGWSQVAPLQRLVKELAAATPQRSDLAVSRAIEQLERFAEAKIIPDRLSDGVERIKRGQNKLLPYLAHEYLNEHWQPAYFADVARAFAAAKLDFAANSDLLKNFYNLSMTEAQRELISDIPSPELRETLKDFCVDHWFRQDVFLRGARRMTAQRRAGILAETSLVMMRPAPEVFEIGKADGSRWRPDPVVYSAAIHALEQGPRKVADLLSLPGLPERHPVTPVELVGTLVGTGLAGTYATPSEAAVAAAARFNDLINDEDDVAYNYGTVIAAPGTKTGVTLSAASYALYRMVKNGDAADPEQLAAEFINRCHARGVNPIVEEKELDDPQAALRAATLDYEKKVQRVLPIWRAQGIV